MIDTENMGKCAKMCWIAAAVVGVLAFFITWGSVGFIVALIIGIALAVLLGIVLPRLFCTDMGVANPPSGEAGRGGPSAEDTSATPQPTPAPKPAPQTEAAQATTATATAGDPEPAPAGTPTPDYDKDGTLEGADEGTKPATLAAPKGGKADDLKQIKGVGPKMEKMLNGMGFYHFDQIAGWNADELAWVNANLKRFKGRASRDNWIEQAKTLAAGGETEFSSRVKDGDVY